MAEKYVKASECEKYFYNHLDDNEIISAMNAIEEMPTADVAPVKHGHWKKGKGNERPTENGFVHDDKYICDCCGWGCCCETKLDFNFCPNCGAKNGRG